MRQCRKLVHMCKFFASYAQLQGEKDGRFIPPPNDSYLYLGAFVNTFCLTCCGMGLVLAFYNAEDGIKDFVFDALGLLFLSNLDDQDGDLRFLGDNKWNANFFGD